MVRLPTRDLVTTILPMQEPNRAGHREGARPSLEQVWEWLADVPDPEIPAVSVVDLGIVRDVAIDDAGATVVTITPTYSGCPATRTIEREIVANLVSRGVPSVRLAIALAPAWTTAWISDSGRTKLLAYGIAPPTPDARAIACPQCGATNTEMLSRYGSTPCKELRRCTICKEPFDHFKCH